MWRPFRHLLYRLVKGGLVFVATKLASGFNELIRLRRLALGLLRLWLVWGLQLLNFRRVTLFDLSRYVTKQYNYELGCLMEDH